MQAALCTAVHVPIVDDRLTILSRPLLRGPDHETGDGTAKFGESIARASPRNLVVETAHFPIPELRDALRHAIAWFASPRAGGIHSRYRPS
ncbi:hypothetical protein R75461_05612 [Paraburkholderia nemoris]|nr:hypothetical protein LMG22931_03472 [Paraburkholderia nemoris]CAE6810144.1 hypothetical protein R75461_05612 [Paraburkholderia nemoris]